MGSSDHGRIAVVVPVLNEVSGLRLLLDDLAKQSLSPSAFVVLVLDGGSSDGTEEMAQGLVGTLPYELLVLRNPNKTVPHARNLALEVLPDDIVWLVELIGHVRVDADHLERRLEAWWSAEAEHGPALAAVGVRVHGPTEFRSRAQGWINAALQSPLGRGGGQFSAFEHVGLTKVPAFAMHRRRAVTEVGGWDPAWPTSQDSDLSMRLLKAGHVLVRDPRVSVRMDRRTGLRLHWRMSVRYGYWRGRLLRKHPSRFDIRESLPLVGLLLTGLLWLAMPAYVVLPAAAYVVVLTLAALWSMVRSRDSSHIFGLPLALSILHAGFTIGLLWSLFGRPPKGPDR
jgi:succinoglycan biosynthesis protein ExoA